MLNGIKQAMHQLFEACGRIFTPAKDDYPATGVQPYTGSTAKH